MEHLTKAATTVARDLGQFTAIAAAYSVDRQGERISPGAFGHTNKRGEKWQAHPVQWDHARVASAVIGSIDPATMHERPDGLFVEGQLDLEDSEVAREAWRSVKRNRIGLSFGYLVVDQHEADGVKVLDALDVIEITLTAEVPADPGQGLRV
jgi:HK97 family phage prohead protease